MSIKVFIDGSAGTTGLKIFDRLGQRADIELIKLPEELRKDINARKDAINSSDVSFLCLPDAAAREAVSLVENPDTVIIDTSTAHRTNPAFAYGFPELSEGHLEALRTSKRIAVPGCHASGFIALVYPLIEAGIISRQQALTCFSLTGYSGGGKAMIADYENDERNEELSSPRQYGIAQQHKHLPEMNAVTGLETAPVFCPIVADYHSGMVVTVPLFAKDINGTAEDIKRIYAEKYNTDIVRYVPSMDNGGFIGSNNKSGKDSMSVTVSGNDERILLIAQYDNLGKGASGAAIECFNIAVGADPATGLVL